MRMNIKKIILPFAAGLLALSLTACNGEDKATKEEKPQEETKQEATKAPSEQDQAAAAKEMQAKLAKQEVDESKVVAVVNEEELKGEEYNAVLASVQGQMQQTGQDPSSKEAAKQVKEQVLNTLVGQTLILQKAKEAKITATDKEIDEQYKSFVEQYGGEEAMNKALKAQSMDTKMLKTQIAESILFEKYQDKVVPAKEVTEKEIKAYYDQAASQAKSAGQDLPPLEEAKEEIKGILKQQQQQELLTKHVEELKADAEIELKI